MSISHYLNILLPALGHTSLIHWIDNAEDELGAALGEDVGIQLTRSLAYKLHRYAELSPFG